jgi:hypothetical protein
MTQSTSPPPEAVSARSEKVMRRGTAVAYLGWAVAVTLLWVQDAMRVMHPASLLFVLLVAITFGAVLMVLAVALWRAVRGPRRLRALGWACAALAPVLLGVAPGLSALYQARSGQVSRALPFRLSGVAAASLMEAQAGYLYPHRVETERLVMFHDGRVSQPERDAREMERHVARLEKLTGRPLRAKIYWVRGPLLGMGRMALYGLALGSSESPDDWDSSATTGLPSLDRHELAHAVLHQHQGPDDDPPTLLVEGWAESQAGMTASAMARSALESRAYKPRTLRELVGPLWYHQVGAPSYGVGAGFVDFLVRRYGIERFLHLYFECRPETFESDCRAMLGVGLDELETQFWEAAERTRDEQAQ